MKVTYTVITEEYMNNIVEEARQRSGTDGEFKYYLKRYPKSNDGTTYYGVEAGPAFVEAGGKEIIVTRNNVYEYESAKESARDGWELD